MSAPLIGLVTKRPFSCSLAIAVLILRQNTTMVKASTYSETTDGWTHYMQEQSEEDIQLLISLATKPGELTTASFYRGYYLCRVVFRRMEHDYYQYKADTFDRDTWNAYVASWREDTFNNPSFRAMWKLQRDYLDPKFVQFMDGVVEESRRRDPIRPREKFEKILEVELRGEKRLWLKADYESGFRNDA